MCIVSNISDWGQKTWPEPAPYKFNPWETSPIPKEDKPYSGPTKEEWEEFKKLLKQAAKVDEITGQPDCVDPEKQKWMESIEKRLDDLEKNRIYVSYTNA
jgi:hypothetical protein